MNRSLLAAIAVLAGAAAAQTYCVPTITNACAGTGYEFVSGVAITAGPNTYLNNTSGCTTTPAYTDYTSTVAPAALAPGNTYTVTVTVGNAWSGDYAYIMLDANGNGTFDTSSGELLATFGPLSSTGGTQLLSGSITIPNAVAPQTRLRVRMTYFTVTAGNEACVAAYYGETEDYAVVTGGGPLIPEYQVNQVNCSHDFNGVQGNAFGLAQTSRCTNTQFMVNLNSPLTALPFDVLVSPLAPVPTSAGGYYTGTQVVNINLFAFAWAFGGFTTPFPGNLALPFSLPTAGDLSTQMAIIDPSNVDGVSLSQPNLLHIITGAPLTGWIPPVGDDAFTALPSPTCFTFYGASQTNAWVTTNGRLGFGTAGSTAYYPVGGQISGDPFIGHWCDLNQASGGNITGSNPTSGITRIDWTGVPYYLTTIPNTFGIQYDSTVNVWSIDGLATVGAAATTQTMLGVSKGSGSGDPGSISFSSGGLPTSGSGSNVGSLPAAIYNMGIGGTASVGLQGIFFVWNSVTGNYDWASY